MEWTRGLYFQGLTYYNNLLRQNAEEIILTVKRTKQVKDLRMLYEESISVSAPPKAWVCLLELRV